MTTAMIGIELSVAIDTVNHHILKLVMENHFGIENMAPNGSHYIWETDILWYKYLNQSQHSRK